MAIGPFTYTPPGVYGPGPVEWTFGSGPTPDWAGSLVHDMCMANIGLKPVNKLRRWIFRYFDRLRSKEAKRLAASGFGVGAWSQYTRVSIEDGVVEIHWSHAGDHTVTMPRAALVPSTLTLILVHDC